MVMHAKLKHHKGFVKWFEVFKRRAKEFLNKPIKGWNATRGDIIVPVVIFILSYILFGSLVIAVIISVCYPYFRSKKITKQKEYSDNEEEFNQYIATETHIKSGMLLHGRNGEKFYWYPFDREVAFNNNVVVVEGDQAASNDGLRFMQELVSSIIQQKDAVYILDSGRNFQNQAERLNKKYMTLSNDEQLCINPFSVLTEVDDVAAGDALVLISSLINIMVLKPKEKGLEGREDSYEIRWLIELGVEEIWKIKKDKAGIDDLVEWLLRNDKGLGKDSKYITSKLLEYCSKGKYGKYFNGKANIKLDNIFNAISFEGLEAKIRKVLIAGVLTYINVDDINSKVRHLKKGIIIKDLIEDFKSEGDKIFVEQCLRTQRSYSKGIIFNINPNCEIFEFADKLCDSTCCMSYDKKAIERLTEENFLWGSIKKIEKSSYKYPEYLITANKILKRIDKKTKYTIEDSIPHLLRGNLKERGHA